MQCTNARTAELDSKHVCNLEINSMRLPAANVRAIKAGYVFLCSRLSYIHLSSRSRRLVDGNSSGQQCCQGAGRHGAFNGTGFEENSAGSSALKESSPPQSNRKMVGS